MNTIIYYRSTIDYLGVFKTKYDIELNIASEYLNTTRSRIGCNNSLVIGRYSVRPFYKELENDLELIGSKLINSFSQHHFIANFNWYTYVSEYTPKTYFNLEDVPKNEDMSFVLKGRCNSKKQEWNTKMFAKGYINASNLYVDLNKDSMLGEQGIIIREYVPLKTLEIGLNGQRFTNEWRFFFYKENLLTNFYYWSGVTEKRGVLTEEGIQFAKNISSILSEFINFFVILYS